MSSLSFPDVNVWLALVADHVHHEPARQWWAEDQSEIVAFGRVTQIGLLRLLTNSAVMNGKPLSMKAAWTIYDKLFEDIRVARIAEPPGIEKPFRDYSWTKASSQKLWADAYLLAMAKELGATLITFDRALARRAPNSLLLP